MPSPLPPSTVQPAGIAPGEEQNTGYVTAIIDLERLAITRQRIAAGDPLLAPALAALREEADGWRRAQPASVMDKTLVPPSGDRHDYLSLGPYWWPDPTTADGLPYIRRDGEVNPQSMGPGVDRIAIERMGAATETLALAWHLTGEAAYAEHAIRWIDAWFLDPATAMRPHLRFGQAIPGRCDGRGIGIIETRRFCQVLNALELLAGSPALTDAKKQAMTPWFATYLEWLRTSPQGQDESREANNHGTWYDVQVAHFALATGATSVAIDTLTTALDGRLTAQVEPDGRQPHELARTRSFTYSLINLSGLLALAELGTRVGIDYWSHPSATDSRLRAAIDHLAPYADPARAWPHQQISGLKRIRLFPFLRQAQAQGGGDRSSYARWIRLLHPDEVAKERANLLWPWSPC